MSGYVTLVSVYKGKIKCTHVGFFLSLLSPLQLPRFESVVLQLRRTKRTVKVQKAKVHTVIKAHNPTPVTLIKVINDLSVST